MNRKQVLGPVLVVGLLVLAGLTQIFGAWDALLGLLPPRSPSAGAGNGPATSFADSGNAEKASPSSRSDSLPVTGVRVLQGPFVMNIRAGGRAEARNRVELAPRVGERVIGVHVREGDRVHKGDILVELDPRPFEIAVKEAEAARTSASLDAQVQLLNDPDASEEKKSRVADRSGLTEAEQRLARARLDLESARLVAPFDGYVSRVDAVIGASAPSNQILITMVDISTLRVRAEVLESGFGSLEPGRPATVTFSALPGSVFEGTVTALSPEVDAERGTGFAYIDLPNPDGRIKPGMYAEVRIAASIHENRISVPREAVLERERRLLVFRATGGRAEWQYVQTGLATDDRIEITSGVSEGDTILVDGHFTLAHGAPVQVRVREDSP